MKNKYLDKPLNSINIDTNIIKKLNEENINTVEELWELSRIGLKEKNITCDEINQITIKMQLHGLDINKKVYSRN